MIHYFLLQKKTALWINQMIITLSERVYPSEKTDNCSSLFVGFLYIRIVMGTKNRVVNLFLYGQHHGKGVGKKLMQKFEQDAKKHHSKEIRIRASLFAIKFYQGAGYKKTTGI